jgi:hypothetical protein
VNERKARPSIRACEACGVPLWGAEPWELLCDLCASLIDQETDLLLEEQHFDPGPGNK